MHARIDGEQAALLTRTGLDWSHRYRRTIEALGSLKTKSAYIDGRLRALNPDGVPVFSRLQAAIDEGRTGQPRLLRLRSPILERRGARRRLPLIERKERLQRLFRRRSTASATPSTSPVTTHVPRASLQARALRAPSQSAPIDPTRLVTAGSGSSPSASTARSSWSSAGPIPRAAARHIGALLLGYYTDDGRLHYAGRAGTGMTAKELKRLAGVLAPLQVPKRMPLAEPPPRDSRFGSPLKLSKVHWVRPEVGRGSDLPHLDRGQPAAAGLISGAAGGQAGEAGRAAGAASTATRKRLTERTVALGVASAATGVTCMTARKKVAKRNAAPQGGQARADRYRH